MGYNNEAQCKTNQTEVVAQPQICPLFRSAGLDGCVFLHTIDPGDSCSSMVPYVVSSYICMYFYKNSQV